MPKSLEDYQTEFDQLHQYLSDSLDKEMIKGDHYDNAEMIICAAYPNETRKINIERGELEPDSDPIDIGGIPPLNLLFDEVEDKATLINDFRKAIQQCRSYNIDEVASEIIKSR